MPIKTSQSSFKPRIGKPHASTILVFILVAGVLALIVDYVRVQAKDQRLGTSIKEFGGRMGGIPFWPFGKEYRISFTAPLTTEQIDQLKELNSLRGTVGIAFVECELSKKQKFELATKFHNCFVFQVFDNDTFPVRSKENESR
ncbi:hypothetical protein OAF74_01250 [bacterium]|jgi:hypothetical protein|nr:hypothetical protein [Planctomicrobium sp.]MDA7503942.1 hypothetical protein [bacterium]MDB4731440.1 hypothetical protein [bacterium]